MREGRRNDRGRGGEHGTEGRGRVEESGIRSETRGFRGSREGLRRLIDGKTHGMDRKLLGRVRRNEIAPRQCRRISRSRINVKNYTKHEKRVARLDHF